MEMNQYLSMFIDESTEHLQSLNENMLQLENSPEDLGIVQIIFRSAHTLKGMSATMGFEDLASLTHQMENVLDLVRNGQLKMNSHIFDTLFKSLDALESMVQDITQGGEGKADVSHIVAQLRAIESGDFEDSAASSNSGNHNASPEGVQLDQYQFSVLDQSIAAGNTVFYIEVTVREDCVLKGARAYMVFDCLERNGEVVKSNPSVQDLEQEKFDRSFSVYFISQVGQEQLQQSISQISEIEQVHIVSVDHETLNHLNRQQEQKAELASAKREAAATSVKASESAPARTAGTAAATRTIRVDIERLDVLMNLFSELLIDRVRLEQLASEIKRTDLTETVEHMTRVSGDLQNIVLKLRMVPVDTVFNRFPRMVRDLAKSLDKKVDLVITGADTELDRTVIEEIGDPLVHLLRNSIDHGVEAISGRLAAGKPETGTIQLRAFHSGNHVFIEIEDDGQGINRDKVLQTALKNGVIGADEAKSMTDEQVYNLLFASGFSTADKVSDISGRGVGLDVVKSKIASLGGNVSVESTPGQGSKFSVQLPLTLSIISAMLVGLGSEKYAIPLSSIVETMVIDHKQIRTVHGNQMIDYRQSIIPVISLAQVFDCPDSAVDSEEESEVIVIRKGDRLAAFMVDEFIGQSEIVIKTMGKYLTNIYGISGATILGDGQVALIIDPNALVK
ncbi:Chemotaxis protein CheA [Paenibacillus sp. CECT 9249]|uniref:chemotaxis protein CheA n=1 Tax=Paenibacillus sp. CECT 9249 TaxID=2845385 RepID=UPI001E4CFE57|nr:chemotaxis protein CheA [Paenibacillus sp. CECT 9249]CAH0119830.1 Chemotaxis protein CheA [Paenibacillus sp. CECT 9249]